MCSLIPRHNHHAELDLIIEANQAHLFFIIFYDLNSNFNLKVSY